MKKHKDNAVMVTREFGNPIFIMAEGITPSKDLAQTWHSDFDKTKLAYHKAVTGYKELTFEAL